MVHLQVYLSKFVCESIAGTPHCQHIIERYPHNIRDRKLHNKTGDSIRYRFSTGIKDRPVYISMEQAR